FDDCTFWYTQEFIPVTTGRNWHTIIGSFRFPSCIPAPADVSGTKTVVTSSPIVGFPLTYRTVVNNRGPGTAYGASLSDVIPSGLTFGSAASTKGSCTQTASVVCNLGSLANGSVVTVTITTTPTIAGSVTNTAVVTSTVAADLTLTNNRSSVVTQVAPNQPPA